MIPKRPVLWLISFIVAIFLVNYFLSSDATIGGTIIFSVVTGIFTLGVLYVGEKIRKKYFPDWGTRGD